MRKLKPLKNTLKARGKGCLNCSLVPQVLPMNYKIVQGFGGSHVVCDGNVFYWPDPWDGNTVSWKKQKTLMSIELKARKKPDSDWRLVVDQPLYYKEYQRQGRNNWVLVKSGNGFA